LRRHLGRSYFFYQYFAPKGAFKNRHSQPLTTSHQLIVATRQPQTASRQQKKATPFQRQLSINGFE